MSAEPKPIQPKSSQSEPLDGDAAKRQPMPFEPKSASKSVRKTAQKAETTQNASASKAPSKASKQPAKEPRSKASGSKPAQPARSSNLQSGIPDIVSRRMIRRIAWCSGVPTALGMSTFVVSYLVVSNDWVQLPTYAVLLVSLGWFGLGVLGVSYGVLSSSWDEAAGSLIGWTELQTNWKRMTTEWKANSEAAQANRQRSKK
jgi:hypothetical protein